MIPYELLQDLSSIVCASKNKKTESLFLKLAQEHIDDLNYFYNWVLNLENTKDISKKFNNDNIFLDSIKYLIKNKDSNLTIQKLLSPFFSDTSKLDYYITTYKSLFNLFNDSSINSYLIGIKDILSKFQTNKINLTPTNDNITKTKNNFITLVELFNIDQEEKNSSISHEELERKQKLRENNIKNTKKIVDIYGFLLYNFSDEILKAINEDLNDPNWRDEQWIPVKKLIESQQLPNFSKISTALPYVPRLKDAPKAINRIYNGIMGRSSRLTKSGPVGIFNYARKELFNSLDINAISTNEYDEVEHIDNNNKLNFNSYFENKGNPVDPSKVFPENYGEDTNTRNESMMKFERKSIINAGYILAVSFLLGRILQGIEERGVN